MAGGWTEPMPDSPEGLVAFYKDADTKNGWVEPDWSVEISGIIVDVAVSDDGYAVAAATYHPIVYRTLYYWANAKSLADEPEATWRNGGVFYSVDMSSDGDSVVAVGGDPFIEPFLHFWSGARSLTGEQDESWTALQYEDSEFGGAVISDDGSIIVATISISESEWHHYIYFFTPDGTVIEYFTLDSKCSLVSISGDGSTVAVGGPGPDSIYVYKVTKPAPVGGIILPNKNYAPLATLIATLAILSTAAIAIAKMRPRRRKP